jgi:uncharacterized protein (DUF427 family)
MKPIKEPGPDHPISINKLGNRVRVTFNGELVADSSGALGLDEATIPTVVYVPRSDVNMDVMSKTSHTTYCPYKGDASYYSVVVGDKTAENAVWTYEDPLPAMEEIRDHMSFYPDRIDAIETLG